MVSSFLRLSDHIPDSIRLTKEKIILGIDPGTNLLGFGVISVDSKGPHYITMGVFDLRKIKDPFEKLANINAGVAELIAEYHPDEMAVESPFYGKNAQVILKLGRAQGAAIIAATSEGIPVTEYAPRKAKVAICGNGAASKEQVGLMVEKTLGISFKPEHLDATDALAIALCHYYQLESPLSQASGSGSWAKFLEAHPERVKNS